MRAILVVIDSFGVGALPDADEYGDAGANTALHICEGVKSKNVQWPNLQKLGLGNCTELLGYTLPGCEAVQQPMASYGVMAEASSGKDTTTGHWELAGIELKQPFQTFPLGYPSFPDELIGHFQEQTGYTVLGNKGSSGLAILEELGEAHLNGEGIIIYTSADSVFQIAAHEEIVPIQELYRVCEIARKLCDAYRIGRVIARPFVGTVGNFTRTGLRRDYSMLPPSTTILDTLQKNGVETVAIGKIGDIFCEQGIDRSYHDSGNEACLNRLVECLADCSKKQQFIFINLVDTDMLYGHRRDIVGYHDAVARVDARLAEVIGMLNDEDLLVITADHGCDPAFKGTDHTREYVPLLSFSKQQAAVDLGIRRSFADVARSLAAYFKI
ncbi:phosphopentomutase [Desulfosediminicola flagellatus]|uniref:phosphopentomutase n=1 Tax=Desulfosediminicola flagellatus TaxID=2569541 RepID=UPI0010AC3620|nr:phosphopentomutase [Desulfosediminicola flagellatus]